MTLLIFAGVLLGAMALGMPIAFALMLSSLALMLHLDGIDAQAMALQMINGADSFALLAVPFFILAGEAMTAGGLSRRLVGLGMALLGHVRGGLGYVAVVAAIFLASVSGSAVADTAALAAILIPMMRRAGYDVPPRGRADGGGRHHRAGDPALHRLHRLRRRLQRVDHRPLPRRHRARPADGRGARRHLVVLRPLARRPRPFRARPGPSGGGRCATRCWR